jgi:hypothetical protein
MDTLATKLSSKLRKWKPATARVVRARIREIIQQADAGTLELLRSRTIEQEVLTMLDEPATR